MSKLIDKLNQMTKALSSPLGFRASLSAPSKMKMLLIARLAQSDNVDHLADNMAGADAVLLARLNSGTKELEKITRSLSDIPWGVWLEAGGKKKVKPIVEAGGDFLVFSANAALTLPEDEKIGRILQVEPSLSEGLLRAVNFIPVDAVLIAGEPEGEYSLTWHHLMLFQHLADLVTKPLLVATPAKISAEELQMLWETGVSGVVVEAGQVETFKELRQTIDQLAFPPRKQRKVAALLPHMGMEAGPEIETEEEEEE